MPSVRPDDTSYQVQRRVVWRRHRRVIGGRPMTEFPDAGQYWTGILLRSLAKINRCHHYRIEDDGGRVTEHNTLIYSVISLTNGGDCAIIIYQFN